MKVFLIDWLWIMKTSFIQVATQQFDTTNMSTAEKIHRFALYVQGEPMKVNAIQTIENAITGSKLNLKTQYEVGKKLYVQVCMISKFATKTILDILELVFQNFLYWN